MYKGNATRQGLFRLHPQKGLTICICMPSKAEKELFRTTNLLSDLKFDTFQLKKKKSGQSVTDTEAF